MVNNYHNRQADIFRPTDAPILVIGAGGIGSMTTLALAKMGCTNITVVDFDCAEEHNIGSQFFKISQLGQPKVTALAESVKEFTDVDIKPMLGKLSGEGFHASKFADDGEISFADKGVALGKYEIVVMAVDSMDARKAIFPAIKDKFELLIDGRMGGQVFNIYAFLNFEQNDYPKSWPPQEEISQEPCTAKAICFNTFGIASYIAATVKKYFTSDEILRCLDGCYCNFFTNYSNDL